MKTTINGLKYYIKQDHAILVATEGLKRPVRNIPSEVEYEGKRYPVCYVCNGLPAGTSYGNGYGGVFKNDEVLSSVSFPESVVAIKGFSSLDGAPYISSNQGAFCGCTNLKDVIFSNSIKEIGCEAFVRCEKILELYFGDNLETIGEGAFYKCSDLKSVDFNEKLISIGVYAFRDCEKLGNVSFPESLTTIERCSFLGCKAMTEVNIPASVTEIGSKAFADSGVKVVNIYSIVLSVFKQVPFLS